MTNKLPASQFPELIIGIAGPIGIDIDEITKSIDTSLKRVGYASRVIRITEETARWDSGIEKPKERDFYAIIDYKMKHASELCRQHNDPATLMRMAIDAIRRHRIVHGASSSEQGVPTGEDSSGEAVLSKTAYIIRQLKRPPPILRLKNLR